MSSSSSLGEVDGDAVELSSSSLNPLTGALAQSAAVIVVVLNSARILRFDRAVSESA